MQCNCWQHEEVKDLEEFKDDATKRTCSKARSDRGPDLQLNAGDQVRERHDVGRQEIHRAGNFLSVHGKPAGQGRRRGPEAVQEGRGKCQAHAGSEDPPRGRSQLPGAGGSESGPAHLAGHPLDRELRA